MRTEFVVEEIAEADTRASVVEGDALTELEARAEDGELFGRGEVSEAEDLAGEENLRLRRRRGGSRSKSRRRTSSETHPWSPSVPLVSHFFGRSQFL